MVLCTHKISKLDIPKNVGFKNLVLFFSLQKIVQCVFLAAWDLSISITYDWRLPYSDVFLTFVFIKVCHLIKSRLTLEQCFQIVVQNGISVRETYKALRPFYSRHNRPSETNPRQYLEILLDPLNLSVWCRVQANGTIGLYFFWNKEGPAVMLNGVWYQHMINTFLFP